MNKQIRDLALTLLFGIIAAVLLNKFVFFQSWIPSESMYPTLKVGDTVFVSRVYNPERLKTGDIVVFKPKDNKDKLIKRLIGKPGDVVVLHGGKVSVNGKYLKEEYVENNMEDFSQVYVVPEGCYFFLGDNRTNSKDSRYWSNPYVEEECILGKAYFRYTSLKDITYLYK